MTRRSVVVLLSLSLLLLFGCSRRPQAVERYDDEAKRLNMRGNFLRDLKEYDSAMYYYRAAIEIGRRHGLPTRVAAGLQNVGVVYSDRGYEVGSYNHDADLDSARACYDSAYQIFSARDEQKKIVSLLIDMASAYFREPRYARRADSLFRQARLQAKEFGTMRDQGYVLYHQSQLRANMAISSRDLHGLRSAAAMLDTAIVILRGAGEEKLAGSAEVMVNQMRGTIAGIERRTAGGFEVRRR